MNNSDRPAMPLSATEYLGEMIAEDSGVVMNQFLDAFGGLTKREHFAAMAMQGMMANTHAIENLSQNDLAQEAVSMADALLKELEK